VTQSFPLETEERDEPYRLSAERANPMSILTIAKSVTAQDYFFEVSVGLSAAALARLAVRRDVLEQSSLSARMHDYRLTG
jgi:hypothetical protein